MKKKETIVSILNKVVQKAQEIDSTKSDLIEVLKQISDNNEEFAKIAGTITDDEVQEIRKIEKESKKLDDNSTGDYKLNSNGDILVHNVEKSKKIIELYVKEPTKEEARYFVDLYYQIQDLRIAVSNQINNIDRGVDQDDKSHKDAKQKKAKNIIDTPATMAYRHHLLNQLKTIENDIKGCLAEYSDKVAMGKYAKSIVGIGPVFATILCASLEIPDKENLPIDKQQFTVGNWWSYAGLNDNNRPWIKQDSVAKEYVEEAIEENSSVLDDTAVRLLCAKTHWTFDHYYKFCSDRKTGKFKGWTKDGLIKATKMIPYNKDLKSECYLIGQSFVKVQNNEKSIYGKLFKERLQYEINRNESGANKEQAAMYLQKKNFSKSTESYKAYIAGKLPMGQLRNRASRHTVKIFLSHLFEFEYLNKYGEPAPVPYVFTLDGQHKDYIEAEVPYAEFLDTNNK